MALATLGCKVNQAETEALAADFARAGFRRVEFRQPADVYVLNTCTVTHIADRKSRLLLRQARRANPTALVVATGCYAQVAAEAVAELNVDLVVGNPDKPRLVERVLEARPAMAGPPLVPSRGRTRAFLKVQDGCDNHCTYCIVPRARGRQHSERPDVVVSVARAQASVGCHELVLTGVHVGAYGRDLPAEPDGSPHNLAGLLRCLLAETTMERIRLSSIEPEDVTSELLSLWPRSRKRLCRHFHLPLQSGCDSVLQRMGRRYRAADYAALVEHIRQVVPGAAITGDVIVAFPGENEYEHAASLDFVRSVDFAGLHVFKYSPRAGTPAARLPARVPPAVAKERSESMMAAVTESAVRFRESLLGERLDVLYEERGNTDGLWTGLTDNYVRVYARGGDDVGDRLRATCLRDLYSDGVRGEVCQ